MTTDLSNYGLTQSEKRALLNAGMQSRDISWRTVIIAWLAMSALVAWGIA